jgi:septal ring factor EnvC (AmiA/AmiB activator)
MEAGTPPPAEPQVKTPQEAAASQDPAEKLEGVHAWVAQLDRKLQTRFYALAAAVVLALAAGIVAVVLALGVQDDSATKGELQELRDQVDNATKSASAAAEDDVADLDDRLAEIESQLESLSSDQSTTNKEVSVVQDDIADLRDQIDAVEQAQEDAAAAADASADENTDGDSP